MASSSNNDKDPDGSQPKTKNPFIRFRQFADAQVSSVLQGIVGLPSAFSKDSSSNTGWAEIDDKLQRRDDLNQQSKQPDNSRPDRENRGDSSDEETEIPVKKSPDWQRYSTSNAGEVSDDRKMDGPTTKDMPLYSPVSTALFAHLNGTRGRTHEISEDPRPPFSTTGILSPDDKISRNNVKTLQQMMLGRLSGGSSLIADYSLLPYLLYSPYSPLRLSSRPVSNTNQFDNFPFCDAFEDLIRVSQGRPMATTWTRIGLPHYWLFHYPSIYAMSSAEWIKGMQGNGLLQQSTKLSELQRLRSGAPVEAATSYPSFAQSPETQKSDPNEQKSSPDAAKEPTDPQTEQDMYARFLRMTSSPASLGSMVESLFADIEKEFKAISTFTGLFPEAEKKFKDLRSSDERLTFGSLFSDIEKEIKTLSPQEAHRAFEHILSDTDKVLATALTPEGRRELRATWSDNKEAKSVSNSVKAGREAPADIDKVVSTGTTTEHVRNEDGSVETSVTVWKRFADGRETVTTSSHIEDPSSEGLPLDNDKQEAKKGKEKQEKQEKRGWFWS